MTAPKGYVDPEYLRMVGEALHQLKQSSYARMQIQPGHKVLDVGCGPATDTIPLANLVGSTGQVVGVDYDNAMIIEADSRSDKAGVSSWVDHKCTDATSLPFEPGYFDSCHSDRLFQHLLDPAAVLAEMVRVTKPGGWVVVLDTDWGSGGIDTSEVDIERRLTRFYAERWLHNGFAGRQLYRLFKRQALTEVSYEVFPTVLTNYTLAQQIWLLDELEQEALAQNVITEDELIRFRTNLEQADVDGVFFGYGCTTLVAGCKTV